MLTDADCRNATCPPGLAKRRLTDSGGLFLEVTPNGSKRWFWRYAVDGKVRAMPLGSYCKPGSSAVLVTLKKARADRDAARAVKDAGTDPLQRRKADKLAASVSSATTYEAVARELHTSKATPEGWSVGHASQWLRCQEKDLFPWLGSLPLADVSAPMLLDTLRRVEKRGTLRMAHDLREYAG
jgi:hypothetical protein